VARIHTHPGEILREDFLVPLGLSARQLADDLHIPANRLTEIIRGNRGVSADTAQRLARRFGTTPHFWMNLQINHDLSVAAAAHDYSKIRPHRAA
jgi:addiction module HigA family antidote